MSIEDHRRRLNGSAESTGQLSVAELIARREAETVQIPVITDDITPEAFEPTVKFKPVKGAAKAKKQPMRELHITELLRREGRADDTQRGGFTVGKLAVAASGGVVLCGSMAFAASSLLSSPGERPLAEVRFDERAQARGASAGTEGGVVKLPSNKTQQADATETQETEEAAETTTRVAPYVQTQQPQRPTQQQPTQTEQPASETPPAASTPTSSPETTQPSTPPSSETPAPPPSSAVPTTPSSSAPTSTSVPTSTSPAPSSVLPTPSNPVDVSVDLGVLDPVLDTVGDVVGGFDFFTPVN